MFALGFLISQQIMFYFYRTEGKPERDVETLTIFMIVATIIGARLGHVFFYEAKRFLANPIDIIKVWEGGLASHGAAIAIPLALFLYTRYFINIGWGKFEVKKRKRPNQSFLWVVDRIVIVVALTGALIRIGNFMNSEIVGKPTGDESGVVFAHWLERSLENYSYGNYISNADATTHESKGPDGITYPVAVDIEFERHVSPEEAKALLEKEIIPSLSTLPNYEYVRNFFRVDEDQNFTYSVSAKKGITHAFFVADGIPLYPTQLYEAGSYLIIFFILFLLWAKMKEKTPEGMLFGLFLILVFGMRFIWEFLKANQEAFEDDLAINMGQILSIPAVLIGVGLFIYSLSNRNKKTQKATV